MLLGFTVVSGDLSSSMFLVSIVVSSTALACRLTIEGIVVVSTSSKDITEMVVSPFNVVAESIGDCSYVLGEAVVSTVSSMDSDDIVVSLPLTVLGLAT